MNNLNNRKNIVSVFALLALLFLTNLSASAQRYSAWSAPQNLGANINTSALEGCPFIAPDNLSLFFASDRAGGSGLTDIYVSTRASANSPWGAPVNLGTNVNSSGAEVCPTVFNNGQSLYFVSDRATGSCGGNDIWVSHRLNNQGEWGPAVNLGCQFNSPQSDITPTLFTDNNGTTYLYISSNRPGGPGLQDIYVSTLQSNGTFGAPILVPGLNTEFNDQRPNIRVRDGLEIFFESNRTGTLGGLDLYVAIRANTSSAWSTPVNLGATVNSTANEGRPSLSFDGRELYFMSDRAGGFGSNDIYTARRRAIFTPFDTDGDGRSDVRAYRPSASTFYVFNSSNNSLSAYSFGGTGESTFITGLSDDYDGDGRSDLVTINTAGGVYTWRILQTGSNTVRSVQWGLSTDQTVQADYDGDGRTDIATYRRSTGIWYILLSSNNQPRYEYWGQGPNDFGMVGDFDGDGINDLTVVRPGSSGNPATWFTRRSSDGAMAVDYWGGGVSGATDSLFPAINPDIDGDGIRDRMVVRDPDNTTIGNQTTYFIQRSSDRSIFAMPWGLDTDVRHFGDYDGDGKTDFATRRDINGQLVWFILLSSNNYNTTQHRTIYWGITGDQ
jgi:Tol biopolymer transport system component